jgi:hypothetical protein
MLRSFPGPTGASMLLWKCLVVFAGHALCAMVAQLVAVGAEWQEKLEKLESKHQMAVKALQVRHQFYCVEATHG